MPKGRWSDKEDQNLKAWIAEGLTVQRISVRLSRSIDSITCRCKIFGLSSGRKTLGQPRARLHSNIDHGVDIGRMQLIDVPDAEPAILKVPPSA